jgi:hypothetical protein
MKGGDAAFFPRLAALPPAQRGYSVDAEGVACRSPVMGVIKSYHIDLTRE